MTRALRRAAVERLRRSAPTVVLEVVSTRGSVPREAGTRMLVWDDGTAGTIGGGHLEWRAIATARAMLAGATRRPDDETFALGASLGQCCGGAVTLRYRSLDAASLAAWPDVPPATVVVYGAGHVGRALVHVLATLDVAVRWIDERPSGFPTDLAPDVASHVAPDLPHVERIVADPAEAEVDDAPADAIHLVLTHRHDLDLRIVEAILRRGDFRFLGLIGSRTKRRRFGQLLRERGFGDAMLDRITCPIGIDGIDGKEPAHIAITVAAQVLPLVEAAADAGPMRRVATR